MSGGLAGTDREDDAGEEQSADYVVDASADGGWITDAMGHGVAAAQLATLGVGSLRNSRRRGVGLVEQAQRASLAISANAAPDQFVTALLARIHLASGAVDWVNAGHLNPLLVRAGHVTEIALEPGLVLGVLPDSPYQIQRFQLHPGDRLALVTDGMFERDAAEAQIEKLLGTLSDQHPREAVQALTAAVLNVTGGSVRDDATVLVVDWHGDTGPA